MKLQKKKKKRKNTKQNIRLTNAKYIMINKK